MCAPGESSPTSGEAVKTRLKAVPRRVWGLTPLQDGRPASPRCLLHGPSRSATKAKPSAATANNASWTPQPDEGPASTSAPKENLFINIFEKLSLASLTETSHGPSSHSGVPGADRPCRKRVIVRSSILRCTSDCGISFTKCLPSCHSATPSSSTAANLLWSFTTSGGRIWPKDVSLTSQITQTMGPAAGGEASGAAGSCVGGGADGVVCGRVIASVMLGGAVDAGEFNAGCDAAALEMRMSLTVASPAFVPEQPAQSQGGISIQDMVRGESPQYVRRKLIPSRKTSLNLLRYVRSHFECSMTNFRPR
mmetsp:Transcript_20558/g.41332  ORF Transcript_20558/g.41332 Transcript_20558/m.41332 type:complete len:308 (+) Transcript_20558:288-1211(+)